MAGRRRHTPEQIIRKLRQGDELAATGADVEEIARQLDVSVPTLYSWRKQYGGMKADDAKDFKERGTRTPCSRSSSPKPNSKRLRSRRLLGENSEPDRQTKRRDDAPGNGGALTASLLQRRRRCAT
ncbi:transposase [Rhodococcus globerulus]|uniref:transposase n=1 Tax=Rhodococcus globerulus TaxID=33008 RepID=UPI001F238425|nr:transposase [Rhodococcus globerulus]MCE4267274.1 transposase [Rhodococcus globerulus]